MADGWNSGLDREAMLRRVAIVLSSLPAPVAANLLGEIDENTKQAVRRTMTSLSGCPIHWNTNVPCTHSKYQSRNQTPRPINFTHRRLLNPSQSFRVRCRSKRVTRFREL